MGGPVGSVGVGLLDMRRKFGQIHKEYSPQARKFYCHFTAITVRLSDRWGLVAWLCC